MFIDVHESVENPGVSRSSTSRKCGRSSGLAIGSMRLSTRSYWRMPKLSRL